MKTLHKENTLHLTVLHYPPTTTSTPQSNHTITYTHFLISHDEYGYEYEYGGGADDNEGGGDSTPKEFPGDADCIPEDWEGDDPDPSYLYEDEDVSDTQNDIEHSEDVATSVDENYRE